MAELGTGAVSGSDSPAESNPEATSEHSPVGAEPTPEEKQEEEERLKSLPFHEHPRFQELVKEKNEFKSRTERLEQEVRALRTSSESRLPKHEEKSPVEAIFEKLTKAGVEEKSARLLAESTVEAATSVADKRVAPVEAAAIQGAIDRHIEEFARDHKDYKDLQPQMYEVFKSLSESDQEYFAKSPKGLQFLYDHVKVAKAEEEVQKAFERGKQEGYAGKKSKESFAPTVGAATKVPSSELTEEQIRDMSIEDYMKRRLEIIASRAPKRR